MHCTKVTSPPDRPVHSILHQLDFSGKHSCHAAITREDYSLTFIPLPIARRSFIQLSELGNCGENENVQTLKQLQRGFEPALSIESDILPLIYRATKKHVVNLSHRPIKSSRFFSGIPSHDVTVFGRVIRFTVSGSRNNATIYIA